MALTGSNMCLKVSKNPKKITNPSAPLKNLRSHQQYIRSFYNWCISEAWHCTPGSEFFTVHLTWGLFLPRPEMSKRQLATSVFLHGGAVLEIWSFIGQWLWKTSRWRVPQWSSSGQLVSAGESATRISSHPICMGEAAAVWQALRF
jgi:hypothetical protein